MGWQDREYARPTHVRPIRSPLRVGLRGRSVVTLLIGANVAIYVLCSLTAGPRRPVAASPIFGFGAMFTEGVMNGQVWRLMTSDYLHWSFSHILMNMIGLHFLGRPLEQIWGPRRFFVIYSVAGILASSFYMALNLSGWLPSGIAAGASGCVLALLGAAAVLFPHAEVYIYFLFPVKIRIVAVVLAGAYVLNLYQLGGNAGGDACHLAGLAFGVWWAMKGDRWWSARGARSAQPDPRFSHAPIPPPKRKMGFRERTKQRRVDAETIDRILEKVHDAGIASLTDREKRALAEATERQQQDDRRLDQTL